MVKDSIWNDSLVDKLKDLYLNKNMTAVNIGNELGFSKNAIIGKIHRLQLNTLKDSSIKEQDKSTDSIQKSQLPNEETIFTIDQSNIKTVINIAKKSNTIIQNKKAPVVSNNYSEVPQATVAAQPEIADSFDKVNHKVFSLNEKKSNLIGKYKLSDIEFNMCVWPFGEEEFTFCGAKTIAGKSYCQEHLDLVYFVTKKLPKKKYATAEEEMYIEEVEDDFEEEEAEI
ncbi:MAG: GcrA family cell cycle regulator [Alphaproteobacteria bacterium]|jgi:GcrA cell cycle regulator|nr:GcrA family cell cycle regulator [Alphaproteobacteria bacterium]